MNYQNTLEKIYKEINFVKSKVINKYLDGGFFVIGEYKGRSAILRTSPVSNKNKIIKMQREYEGSKIIDSYCQNNDLKISFNKIITSGTNQDLKYIIRKYSKDETLSMHEENNKPVLHGFDIIRDTFINDSGVILDDLINNIRNLQKIDSRIIKNSTKNLKLFSNRFDYTIPQNKVEIVERELNVVLDSQMEFYSEHLDEYCSDENIKICMGDLIPPNILVTKDKHIILLDLEWFGIDNYMFDFSYLWLYLWKYPKWQKYLMSKIIITQKDKNFFHLSIIRSLINWYSHAFETAKGADLEYKVNFYQNHIWLKYLKAVEKSFL